MVSRIFCSHQTRTIALQLSHALNHPPTIEHKQAVESKSLYELTRINPYDFPVSSYTLYSLMVFNFHQLRHLSKTQETGYECTVTITEISVENKWWYPTCTKCFKTSTPQNAVYHCNDCNWDKYTFR
jgi:hypothetical protein